MATLLLDQSSWDLVVGADGNIAVASNPYALAQDAASAIKTFQGECYLDVSVGVPYLTDVLGKNPSVALLKGLFSAAAMTVPGVASAKCFLSAVDGRAISGQVQVVADTGQASVIDFVTINPQGSG